MRTEWRDNTTRPFLKRSTELKLNLQTRPPKVLLNRHHAYVKTDTPFRSWCRLKQSLYRQIQGWNCGSGGSPPRMLGNYLIESDASEGKNFLDASTFEAAKKRLEPTQRENKDVIEDRRLFSNLLTSQTLCFNLFLPQVRDLRLATKIWRQRRTPLISTKANSSPLTFWHRYFGTFVAGIGLLPARKRIVLYVSDLWLQPHCRVAGIHNIWNRRTL